MPTPPPPVLLPELPKGWRRATSGSITPAIQKTAVAVLKTAGIEYGGGHVLEIAGRVLAFRREPHYDDHIGGVLKWHPGISVWERHDPAAPLPVGMADLLPKVPTMKITSLLLLVGLALAGFTLAMKARA